MGEVIQFPVKNPSERLTELFRRVEKMKLELDEIIGVPRAYFPKLIEQQWRAPYALDRPRVPPQT